MKHYRALIACLLLFVLLNGCQSGSDKKDNKKKSSEKVPGLATMQKFGKKLTASEILNIAGEAMQQSFLTGGGFSYAIFNAVLHSPNDQKVFVVEYIEYNDQGLATLIEGYVETPATYIEFIQLGGLGSPVYEAIEPNEFGVIFGRPGDVAVREGVVVKTNPFEAKDVYYLKLNAETYDKIMLASVLSQAWTIAREPYLQNMIVELQGQLLNSSAKEQVLEAVKKFKEENPELTETEVMVNFLKANKSFMDRLENLDKDSNKRIKNGKKLMNSIAAANVAQSVHIAEHFAFMAAEFVTIAASIVAMDPEPLADYIYRNVPKNSSLKYKDLQQVHKYSKYQFDQYKKIWKSNKELWKNAMDLVDQIKD